MNFESFRTSPETNDDTIDFLMLDSGIAERIMTNLEISEPTMSTSPEDYTYEVRKSMLGEEDSRSGEEEEVVDIILTSKKDGTAMAFEVREGEPFGGNNQKPLIQEQIDTIYNVVGK